MKNTFLSLREYVSGVKGLIFDYGGTIDTDGRHWSSVIWDAWQKAGVGAEYPVFREAYVYAERELARTRHILPEHDFADVLRIKVNIQLQWLAEQGAFPAAEVGPGAARIADICHQYASSCVEKAKPVLQALGAKFPMVLVSNFYGNISTVLENFGIKQYFRKIIESAVVGVRKPDPEIFSLGVKALGLAKGECLVVGDSYRKDIEPALKAGCKAIWLEGEGWDADSVEGYDYRISSLSQLSDILL